MSRTVDAATTTIGPLDWLAARPRLAALLGALCIAFSGIIYRYADVSPSTGVVFRCLFGLPVLAAVALVEHRRHGPMPRNTFRLAVIAGVAFAIDLQFLHLAIDAVGAGLATVLANLQVLLVGVFAWLFLGERPSRTVVVALPVVLVGIVLISGVVGSGSYGVDPALGVVFGVLTALAYAAYLLIIRRGGRDLRRPAGPVAVATASTAVIAIVIGSIIGDLDLLPQGETLGWLILLGLTAQSAGVLLIAISLPRLPAVATSIILLFQPVAAVSFAMFLLAEAPSIVQLVGVALVVGGIAVATLPVARVRDAIRRGAA